MAVEPQLPEVTDQDVAVYKETLKEITSVVEEINRNERARKDIANWKRDILVKMRGGYFAMIIDDGEIRVEEKALASPDFVIVCEDPKILLDGLAYRGAITDSIINKKLWISKNMEFNTIFKLNAVELTNRLVSHMKFF